MPFHMAAFFENVDQTLDNIAVLQDDVLFTSGDDLALAKGYEHILAAWLGSASAERGRIVSPTFRSRVLPDLQPVEDNAEPSSPPSGLHGWWDNPFKLEPSERVNLQLENDAAGAAEDAFGLLWLGSGPLSPSTKGWIPLRATTTAAAMTANAWNVRTLTLAQSLPPGKYELGGLRAQSTSLIAARCIFSGQTERPGCMGVDTDVDIQDYMFRTGRLGVWGTFTHDQPPQIQFLVDAADNEAQQLILDVRRVGSA